MKVLPNTIFVTFDKDQKQRIGYFYIVPNRHLYEQNGRETNPVVARVVLAGEGVPLVPGDLIVLHHNLTSDPVYALTTGAVIPYDRWVLAKVDADGELVATDFNIICNRMRIADTVGDYAVPESAQKLHPDKVQAMNGDVFGIRKWADYEVVYHWKGEVRRRVVLWVEDIVCEIPELITSAI